MTSMTMLAPAIPALRVATAPILPVHGAPAELAPGLVTPHLAATVPRLEPAYDEYSDVRYWAAEELPLGGGRQGIPPTTALNPRSRATTRHVAGHVLIAVGEVLAQRRPLQHLARWATDDVLAAIGRMDRLPTSVRSVRVTEPARGVAEAAAVLARGPRVVAAAARFDLQEGRWRCTAFDVL